LGLGLCLVFAGAALTIFILKRHAASARAPRALVVEAERPKTPVAAPINPPPINLTTTNRPEPVETGEDRVVALVTEGNQLLAAGKFAEAAESYAKAVHLAPGDEDLHYNLAIALARLGKNDEAKKQYEEALEIFPDYADARNNLGNLLMKQNRLEAATDQFRAAIKLMPDNASFHNNLGTALGRQRKVAEAQVEFREAVRLNPAYVEARVNLGNACLSAGQAEEAINQLNEALRLQPDFLPAIQAMQRARQRQASRGAQK
jgi:Tfp pilus assembly protein PilF